MKLKSTELKLTIELVPQTSWYDNLRKALPLTVWKKMREKTYAKYGHKCGICGAEGRLSCHELWEYDDKKHIQKLNGFIALCDMCHFVKHLGLVGILSSEGKLDADKIIKHFMKVNNCDKKTFEEHKKKAFDEWRKRSQYKWRVDFGKYKNVIQNASKKK